MMRNLLLLQLGFNVLMLLALLVLARMSLRSGSASSVQAAPSVAKPGRTQRLLARSSPRTAIEAVPQESPLTGLVEHAEAQEMAAEAALRARLARYGGRVANA